MARRRTLDEDLRALDLMTETALRELAALMERTRSRRAALCLERSWVETQLALRLTAAAGGNLPVAVPPLVAGSVEATWAANARRAEAVASAVAATTEPAPRERLVCALREFGKAWTAQIDGEIRQTRCNTEFGALETLARRGVDASRLCMLS